MEEEEEDIYAGTLSVVLFPATGSSQPREPNDLFFSSSYSSLRMLVRSCSLARISRRNDVPLPYVTVDAPRDGWGSALPQPRTPRVCDNAKYMSPFLVPTSCNAPPFPSPFPLFLYRRGDIYPPVHLPSTPPLLPKEEILLSSYPFDFLIKTTTHYFSHG